MRLSVERDALAAAVKRASGAVTSRNVIPILACVHIKAADNTLRVTGTNMDEWVAVRCEAAVTDAGTACVDASLFSAWLQASPKGSLVDLSIIDGCLVAVAGRATGSFVTLPHEEYPTPEKADKGVEVPARIGALADCHAFTANEETRQYLNGVAVSGGHFVATDGHKLCAINVSAPKEVSAIIPNAGVRQIVQFNEGARLWIGASYWRCEGENIVAGGKLMDLTYPDWGRLVPEQNPAGSVDADAFLAAVRQTMVASGERARAIKLSADGDELSLSCQGPIATATGAIAYDGKAFAMGVNGKYADTAIGIFSGSVVDLTHQQDPGIVMLTCAAKPDHRVVVMGMRL